MRDPDLRYRSLFDHVPIGLYRTIPGGQFLDANAALVQLLGYPDREALLGENVSAIWADPEERRQLIARLEREGVVRDFEMRVRRYDGSIIWVRNSVRAVRDEDVLLCFEGVVEDVTERKRAELASLESEERYRLLVEYSPDPIAVHTEGKLVYANGAAARVFGAENVEQLVGRAALDFVHPDYRDLVIARMRRSHEERSPVDLIEEKMIRLDGREIDVEVAAIPITYQGRPATQVVLRDITERKRAERVLQESGERYRQLASRLAEAQAIAGLGSFEWDVRENRTTGSEEFYRTLDLRGSEPKTLQSYLERTHPLDRSFVEEQVRMSIEGHEPFDYDHRIVRRDGTVRTVNVRGEVICDSSGRPLRVVGTTQDITERKQIEDELARARDAALEASRLKSAFLANTSHEIRTPLNVILGYNSLIADHLAERGDHSQDESLRSVERAGRRLMQTIHGILDLSRIETGSFELRRDWVDVAAIVGRQVGEHESPAREKGLTLRHEISEGGAEIWFDEHCLSQALGHLLSNAIKFTDQGGVIVRLSRDPADGDLCLEVRDTGIGIDESYLPRLFDPFTQEQSGYTRGFEGPGLGLALTRRYLELNDARITVDTRKGEGSTFRVHFARASERRRAPVLEAGPPRPLVLLVEDEPDTQVYMRTLLRRYYEVITAATGEETRQQLEAHSGEIRMVLMDLSLRGSEDGLMLTSFLREREEWRRIPIIAVTAHAFAADRDRALASGCDAFLSKPFEPRALLELMRELLARRTTRPRISASSP